VVSFAQSLSAGGVERGGGLGCEEVVVQLTSSVDVAPLLLTIATGSGLLVSVAPHRRSPCPP